ncbi:MAG TPA: dienelactone hydrolase family protein [Myxococcota bacterium]|jgi:carboxymethylenebutenolidase|nr:dienelactone hydrolase family protein [Myxococcota bacterium]
MSQERGSRIEGREIALATAESAAGASGRGYLALPASGRGPGVIVIHEWWGLVPHVREVCDRLAREGFVALAPDLYRGAATTDPDEAGRLMLHLELPRAAADLDAAVATLFGQTGVTGPRVGAIGFCMGGQLALLAATRNRRIGAVVDFYGIHPSVTLDLSRLEAAVLGIFAERDEFVPPEAARKLEAELRGAGKRASLRIFPGVGHAFFNDARADAYDAVAAAEAWRETLAFLRAELA